MKKKLHIVLFCVFIGVFFVSAWKLFGIYRTYEKGNAVYGDIAEKVVKVEADADADRYKPQVTDAPKDVEKKEKKKKDKMISVDFKALQATNPEIIGWLYIPDSAMSYPLLQASDNDKYLHQMYNKQHSIFGSIFMDYRNKADLKDLHTIIYGHNMKNGSMFHNIRYFAEAEYFEEHQELYIYMPEKILKYQIISCYEYDDRHLMGTYDFSNEEIYAEYLEEIMKPRSMYTMIREDVELTTEDRIVTLSTCIANKPNNRRLLQAVLIEEIEAEYRGAAEE